MRVAALYVYPIKSLRGISLAEAELDERGIRHDRRWMLVDADGVFLSQRRHPRMALLSCALENRHLRVSAPGAEDLLLPLHPPGGPAVDVEIWNDRCRALPYPDEQSGWFAEALDAECRLVFMPDDGTRRMGGAPPTEPAPRVGFSDGYPLHLVSDASLRDLNRRLPEPVGIERFRPNLVVEGAEPYAEDAWARFRMGDVQFSTVAPCIRCAVTTVDPAQGTRGKEPLRTLAAYRMGADGVEFGIYTAHEARGTVRVGDPVEVVHGL